jgi:hypothetical protein
MEIATPTDAPTAAAHAPEAEPAANRAPAPEKDHFTVSAGAYFHRMVKLYGCGFHLQNSTMGLRRANSGLSSGGMHNPAVAKATREPRGSRKSFN